MVDCNHGIPGKVQRKMRGESPSNYPLEHDCGGKKQLKKQKFGLGGGRKKEDEKLGQGKNAIIFPAGNRASKGKRPNDSVVSEGLEREGSRERGKRPKNLTPKGGGKENSASPAVT